MNTTRNQIIKAIGLLTAFLLLLSQFASAQQSLKPTGEVVPPSPEVSALNKYVDIPVSNYTGTPNIGLPIFTIPLQQFSVPVGLSYHASGLKVSEHASWVGAGWSLSGGGAISRVIRGLPDEFHEAGGRKGFFHSRNEYLAFMTTNGSYNGTEMCYYTDEQIAGSFHNPDQNNYDLIADGRIDFEPDVFYFNSPFGSGKFVFDHQQNIQWLTPTDVEILAHPFVGGTYNTSVPLWVIRLPDGTELSFRQEERQMATTNCFPFGGVDDTVLDLAYTAWKITEVRKGSEWVQYDYVKETQEYIVRNSQSQQFVILNLNSVGSVGSAQAQSQDCVLGTTAEVKRLTTMRASNGYRIEFTEGALRSDLTGSKSLEYVTALLDGDTLSHLRFNYDYFGDNVKLRLDGVDQLANDQSGDFIPLQSYEYYGEGNLFPAINSYKQDHYGFYNAAAGNLTSMIPEWKDPNYHINTNTTVDRSSNLTATLFGTLKKITYPTGGYHTYEYELHDFSAKDYLKSYTYEAQVDSGSIGNILTDYADFTVDSTGSISIIWETPVPDGLDAGYSIRKKDASGNYTIDPVLTNRPGYMNEVTFNSNGNTFFGGSTTFEQTLAFTGSRFNIEPGDYRLKVESEGSPIHIRLVLDQYTDVAYEPIGGLRIKSTAAFDPVTGQTLRQLYEYTEGEGLNKTSSGNVFTRPDFGGYFTTEYGFSGGMSLGGQEFTQLYDDRLHYREFEENGETVYAAMYSRDVVGLVISSNDGTTSGVCQNDELHVFVNLTSSPAIPIATSNGSHIGYSEVKVYQIAEPAYQTLISNLGPTTYAYIPDHARINDLDKSTGYTRFTYVNDLPLQILPLMPNSYEIEYHEPNSIFPFQPQEDLSYKNGKLLSQEVYGKSTTGFKLQSRTENQYREQTIGQDIDALIVKRQVTTTCGTCPWNDRGYFLGIRPYKHQNRWHYLTKTVSRQIENDTLVNEVEYFYDTANYSHFMLTGSRSVDSEADVTEVVIDRDAFFPSLVTQQETFVNNNQIAGEQITYLGFQPAAYSIWDRATGLYTEEMTLEYDAFHQPIEVATSQGSKQTYLWREEGNRLLASFTNVSDAELDAMLTLENIDREWLRTKSISAAFKTKMNNLRNRLGPHQQMAVYYYDQVYGPGTVIDANGTPVKYEYDSYGRLKRVLDQSDNVIEEVDYHYTKESNQ